MRRSRPDRVARATAPLALFLVAACHDVASLPLPPNHAARALVLILGEGPRALAARSVDPAAGDAATWAPFSSRAGATVYAVSFSCPLDRLGLIAGAQALAESSSSIELVPPPAAVFEAALDATTTWQPSAGLPPAVDDALRRLPLPPSARCHAVGARYTAEDLRLPNEQLGPPSFAIALDERRVLAGTRRGYLFEVTRAGATRLTRHEDKFFRAGMRARDGTLWMVDSLGAVWHGTLETDLVRVGEEAPFPESLQRAAVAGPTDDSPFEMFAETEAENRDERGFHRFDGLRWTELSTFTPERNTIYFPAVAWLGPQSAMSIGTNPDRPGGSVMFYDRGVLKPQSLRGTSPNASILHHPTLGVLVGHDQDGISRYEDGRWDLFRGALPLIYVRVMVAEGDGLLYIGSTEINFSQSAFAQYHPSIGFCQTYDTFTEYAATHVARLGDDTLVVLSVAGFDVPMRITLLTRTQEARSCSEP